jgi:uncharacterized membrane protein required for colicin V production
MFPWLDLLLVGVIIWGAVTGYLGGLRRAIIRMGVLVGALLCALPFASNCAVFLAPRLQSVFEANYYNSALPTGGSPLLNPWQEVLTLEAVAGDQHIISIGINVAALTFLMLAVLIAFRLLEKPKFSLSAGGLAAGSALGILAATYFLALSPVLVLGKAGMALADAAGQSRLVPLLQPIVQGLVQLLAPFVM